MRKFIVWSLSCTELDQESVKLKCESLAAWTSPGRATDIQRQIHLTFKESTNVYHQDLWFSVLAGVEGGASPLEAVLHKGNMWQFDRYCGEHVLIKHLTKQKISKITNLGTQTHCIVWNKRCALNINTRFEKCVFLLFHKFQFLSVRALQTEN